MKKILFYLLAVLLITACNSKSNNASNDSETATVTEDSGGAKTQGYNKGYQDGYDDGYGWKAYMVGYNHANSYQTSDAYNAYLNGYKEGYDQGYKEGEEAIKAEREKEKLRDWHNWEKEDVDGIYVWKVLLMRMKHVIQLMNAMMGNMQKNGVTTMLRSVKGLTTIILLQVSELVLDSIV